MYAHECFVKYSPNSIFKFNDDTTLVGQIDNDETEYREEIGKLVPWHQSNNLVLNVSKTKDLVVDLMKLGGEHNLALIKCAAMEMVGSFMLLSIHITSNRQIVS